MMLTYHLGYGDVKNRFYLPKRNKRNRKRPVILWVVACLFALSLASCATICGGAKYNAEVIVDNHPKAEIQYNGQFIGTGKAYIKIGRRDADKVIFTVKEEGKKEQAFAFQSRVFRGWSFVGTVLGWTGYANGIYLP